MRFHALATDYDGTLAQHGTVDQPTLEALTRLKASGRKLILVTGRELEELLHIFPQVQVFERVVAENGGLLFNPATKEIKPLHDPPSKDFVDLLRSRGVHPLSVGRVIVATQEPYESVVLQAIRQLGLELQVIFNKGAVMVLPSGVNKATGLAVALDELNLSFHNVVGIGDAENDHAFLERSAFAAAVANALPALKEKADLVTQAHHGAGVAELIQLILQESECPLRPRLPRDAVLLGMLSDGSEVLLPAYGTNVLVAGTSGGGKSTLVTGLLERLLERSYQACILDPEGDYPELGHAIVLGDRQRASPPEEVVKALEKPATSLVVNLMNVSLDDRPAYFQRLFLALLELRTRTGHPHWIMVDEAHHLMPASWHPSVQIIPSELKNILLVTVHPNSIAPSLLSSVDLLIALGDAPGRTATELAEALRIPGPDLSRLQLERGQALGWWIQRESAPFVFNTIPGKTVRRRHTRKYMAGELSPEQSFYFEGPDKKLHLRAQNLQTFLQLAEGIDDDTWLHHLREGHYSHWFRDVIKDPDLAEAAEATERAADITPAQSRAQIAKAIQDRYTAAE